ncbi:putative NADH-flavin reductase [Paenibacillus turicensis]|uniref:NADH-flavin reductase n=1 Tax=Paenibacillus turicensis TaxID=160487 RepID=A0ABS4FQK6_9BACL|nr:SDR family oxidoreductase [Paenibacillus turicensis]MBP1904864.1 putative NADH-flavin reductase [Paenibacillus turicensis]
MNLLILGGTGRVGSKIVSYALHDGHQVTVLARTPEKLEFNHDGNLKVIQGNVLNQNDIMDAMRGIDVVISALNTDGTTTLTGSMPLIINAMEQEGIQRIITVGTAGILQSRTTPNVLRYQSSESKRKSTRAAEEHHRAYEMLRSSTLDWTIVCPTYLPDGEGVGQYRVQANYLPEGGSKISVVDTAQFVYSQINNADFIKLRVGIAY